ncbi:MAG TPA: phosphoribosylformylglycinamidine synthase subunit PurQ [Candidatus Cybelea sp.]|jgi:phosphoribosylformylglycinamidine synthase subunit PurQ / glutaminase|nr:phosphoribosylformylglycinamidine synthase subunit PurQ [Candidatus Cybelea sp.]
MKFGVVVFPGSNCDDDAHYAVGSVLGQPVEFIWHQSEQVSGFDAIILPGGFAFGDYLRTGAIARFSPVMKAVSGFARSGGLVLGVCNGFQILLEAGLLPGAMMRNNRLRFLCRQVHVRVENTDTPFTCAARPGQILKIPIAHMEGNYYCEPATLTELERNNQIVFRYVHADGRDAGPDDFDANPNGALAGIAGLCNRERNVVGLMPHPERAVESTLGSEDGLVILRSVVESLSRHAENRARAATSAESIPA